MQPVYITDPAWWTSFPRVVAPLPDEWLPGMLLRCDEVNGWDSGTSFSQWLRAFAPIPYRFWTHTPNLIVLPWQLKFDPLVQLLALPEPVLLATTYDIELARILRMHSGPSVHVTPVFLFRVCPECLAQDRLLRRTLLLPQIRSCPQHQLLLLEECQCGNALHLFSPGKLPFACHHCGLDWINLPRIFASQECLALQQKYLSLYSLFFSEKARLFHEHARYLVNERLWDNYGSSFYVYYYGGFVRPPEVVSLGPLVSALVHFGYSSQDISSYNGPQRSGSYSKKWQQLYNTSIMEIFTQSLLLEDSSINFFEEKSKAE